MPTLAEISGAAYPREREGRAIPPCEGVSLVPLFRGVAALPERAICIQHEGACAIVKGEWKLVLGKRFPAPARWELYQIRTDPCETNDLAPKHPDLVARLAREWLAWAERTGTPVPKAARAKPPDKSRPDTTSTQRHRGGSAAGPNRTAGLPRDPEDRSPFAKPAAVCHTTP
jgi:arylsulfatase A-like enzyme